MPFSATADGKVSAGTCSLTEDCHAGPNSAMPLPTMKQNASRISGVTRPSQASTDSAVAPTSAIDSETSATMRRSYMSAKMRKNNGEIMKMRLSRRALLQGAGALPLAAGSFGFSAFAQAPSAAPSATEIPPILFAHGNGDHAALWITTLWRMESNG